MKKYSTKAKTIPIRVGRSIVGKVRGDIFEKQVQASRHFLRTPPAIALDIGSLAQAEKAGAQRVQIIDTESGAIYRASIERIHKYGFELDRGFGRQLALTLESWTCIPHGELEQLSLF